MGKEKNLRYFKQEMLIMWTKAGQHIGQEEDTLKFYDTQFMRIAIMELFTNFNGNIWKKSRTIRQDFLEC